MIYLCWHSAGNAQDINGPPAEVCVTAMAFAFFTWCIVALIWVPRAESDITSPDLSNHPEYNCVKITEDGTIEYFTNCSNIGSNIPNPVYFAIIPRSLQGKTGVEAVDACNFLEKVTLKTGGTGIIRLMGPSPVYWDEEYFPWENVRCFGTAGLSSYCLYFGNHTKMIWIINPTEKTWSVKQSSKVIAVYSKPPENLFQHAGTHMLLERSYSSPYKWLSKSVDSVAIAYSEGKIYDNISDNELWNMVTAVGGTMKKRTTNPALYRVFSPLRALCYDRTRSKWFPCLKRPRKCDKRFPKGVRCFSADPYNRVKFIEEARYRYMVSPNGLSLFMSQPVKFPLDFSQMPVQNRIRAIDSKPISSYM